MLPSFLVIVLDAHSLSHMLGFTQHVLVVALARGACIPPRRSIGIHFVVPPKFQEDTMANYHTSGVVGEVAETSSNTQFAFGQH